jgi:hypothetical protein
MAARAAAAPRRAVDGTKPMYNAKSEDGSTRVYVPDRGDPVYVNNERVDPIVPRPEEGQLEVRSSSRNSTR